MPLGNPEEYMAQGMPPEEAMAMSGMGMAAPMPPMGPDPMMGPPPMGSPMGPEMGGAPDETAMLAMLMQAVTGKWDQQQAELAGEKGMLMDTLMSLADAQPPAPQDMFAEGAPMNAGFMPEIDENVGY